MWLDTNWFTLIQSVGIVGSLCFTAFSLRMDARGRRVGDFLTLTGHHRELWSEIQRQPALGRIFQQEVDLIASPITLTEEEFLNLVCVHFQAGWELAKQGSIVRPEILAADAKYFFSLPIPRAVWQKSKSFRDEGFVRFVESSLGTADSEEPECK